MFGEGADRARGQAGQRRHLKWRSSDESTIATPVPCGWKRAGLGRREFLAGAAALGLGAALSACGGSSSAWSSQAVTHLDANAVLKFSMSTTIPGLDPQKWWNGAAACGQCVIYESLLTIDPYTSKLVPLVAKGMPAARRWPHLHV